jgi:eukaryotic-like serine/threonine-protein kinase
MGAAEHLVGHELLGRNKKKWTVLERLRREKEYAEGVFYSVGYRVRADDGRDGFMKVTDLDLLTDQNFNVLERMSAALQQHTIERQMLEHCRGNNMDRIALAIDFGDTILLKDGLKEPIFYIIFELAECDVRVQVDKRTQFDIVWIFCALHDLAVAIQQLHRGNITHNDIKPSNFLVFLRDLKFRERLQKLTDLGCATSPLMASIYDDAICAGDPRYAPPEVMYAKETDADLRKFDARRSADIYHLGSMIFFLVTGRMLTPEIVRHLSPEHRPPDDENDWVVDYADVIIYWREAFGRALIDFRSKLPCDANGKLAPASEALLEAIIQLADPDPKFRGHPHNRVGHNDPYSVQQYIALFDSLRRRAMH